MEVILIVCGQPIYVTNQRREFLRRTQLQALESLAREIDRLEADILDPSLSSAATDPAKACSRLEAFRHRLSDLQVSTS